MEAVPGVALADGQIVAAAVTVDGAASVAAAVVAAELLIAGSHNADTDLF